MQPDLHIERDLGTLTESVAQQFIELTRDAVRERGECRVCLAGGNTPRGIYRRLGERASELDWRHVQLYFGDERCVPPDDRESNFRMLRESLLARAPVPPSNVHRIEGELEPAAAAARYAQSLHAALGVDAQGWPERGFDLVLLGLGADAHTASLFPGSALAEHEWASARRQPATGQWRVTLTEPVLNAARQVIFLVAGADKASAVFDVVRGPRDLTRLPGQRIAPSGRLALWTDHAAAARLPPSR